MKLVPDEMPGWMSLCVTVLSWMLFFVFSFVYDSLGLILIPFLFAIDPCRKVMHSIAQLWARSIINVSPIWSLKTQGQKNINRRKHYVVVANHQSILDILVLLAGLPIQFKFLAKKELFPIPLVGWHMSLAGYIPVDRVSRSSATKAASVTRQWVSRGISVAMFPEGTRSPNGEIQSFKLGAFKIAAGEKVEILPVVIDGTSDAVPKKSWVIKKVARFQMVIGKPVAVTSDTVDEVKEQIHADMVRTLDRLRKKKEK